MERAHLEGMKVVELRRLGLEHGIANSQKLTKKALVEALLRAELEAGDSPHPTAAEARGVATSTMPPPVSYDTVEMARMYVEQGLPERAIELYGELLAARPDDAELKAGLVEAERAAASFRVRRPVVPTPPPSDEPLGMLDLEEPPEAYGVDEVEVMFRDPFTVFAYWEVTQPGLDAARAHLGEEGRNARLVLRIFTTEPGEEERYTRDINLEDLRGRRYIPAPSAGVRLRAAAGLVAPSGLFSPIAHSSRVRVPPAEAGAYEPWAVEWMEVQPATRGAKGPEPITKRAVGPEEAPQVGRPLEVPGEAPGQQPTSPSPTSPAMPWRWRPGSSS